MIPLEIKPNFWLNYVELTERLRTLFHGFETVILHKTNAVPKNHLKYVG